MPQKFEAWDLKNLRLEREGSLPNVINKGCHSSDRKLFATSSFPGLEELKKMQAGDFEGWIRGWNTDGQAVFKGSPFKARARLTCFSPDGKHLIATGVDNLPHDMWQSRLMAWETATGKCVNEIYADNGREGWIAIACSPDGHHFASAQYGRPIQIVFLNDLLRIPQSKPK